MCCKYMNIEFELPKLIFARLFIYCGFTVISLVGLVCGWFDSGFDHFSAGQAGKPA